jgi:hypothetical protein
MNEMNGACGTKRTWNRRGVYSVLIGNPEGDNLEDLGLCGRIILK